MNIYAITADIVLVTHAFFIVFVVIGQLFILLGWWLRWSWPRNYWFRICHIVAIGYVVLESVLGITCPLTIWEKKLRQLANHAVYEQSFVAYWLDRIIFYQAPGWVFTLVYSLFFLLVLLSYIYYAPKNI